MRLIEDGTDANFTDKYGRLLMHLSASRGGKTYQNWCQHFILILFLLITPLGYEKSIKLPIEKDYKHQIHEQDNDGSPLSVAVAASNLNSNTKEAMKRNQKH